MNVRSAERDDLAQIAEVAQRSLEASYSLSPDEIQSLLEEEFSEEALERRIDADDVGLYVVEGERPDGDGTAVLGFADVDLEEGTLRWLHVHPQNRGAGIGTELFDRARDDVRDRTGGPITARILEGAVEGESFLERFGLTQTGTVERDLGGDSLPERTYTREGEEHDAGEPAVDVPETVEVDGEEKPLNREDPIPGRESPFFEIREGEGNDENYGYFCGNCGNTDVVADGLDRLACGDCGNEHVAENWDDAYL